MTDAEPLVRDSDLTVRQQVPGHDNDGDGPYLTPPQSGELTVHRKQPPSAPPLVAVEDLAVSFAVRHGRVDAVRGVSFTVAAGECVALVGESGSGKSVTARSLVGLAGPRATVTAGRLELDGVDLLSLRGRAWSQVRGRRIGLVLQDALVSLDPLRTVGAEVAEPLRLHGLARGDAARTRVVELLRLVGVPEPEERARQRPYELSGGLRQRALIASAIAAEPGLIVADEPTTALDVSVQAQILDLLAERAAAGAGLLLISHDLAVVAALADRVAVMRAGVVVEQGPVEEVLTDPRHPYTRALLAAVPTGHPKGTRLSALAEASDVEAHDVEATGPTETPTTNPVLPRTTSADQPESEQVAADPDQPVIRARHLVRRFRTPSGGWRTAVDDVSFDLRPGETLGVVGESGSGKTTLARLVLGLTGIDGGSVEVAGQPWSRWPERRRRTAREAVQVVNQDPLGSFDPRYPVGRVVAEPLAVAGWSRAHSRERVAELLGQVGLDPALAGRRPIELSGGQRQRVAIARALARRPRVLVCDEPVSALDVTVQAQVLDLLSDLQRAYGLAMLFISHDLGVIQHMSDRVLVMKDGRVVESGPADAVFHEPGHPYTRALLAALPSPEDARSRRRAATVRQSKGSDAASVTDGPSVSAAPNDSTAAAAVTTEE